MEKAPSVEGAHPKENPQQKRIKTPQQNFGRKQ